MKKMRLALPLNLPSIPLTFYKWIRDFDGSLWDVIFLCVSNEEDKEGAQLAADIFNFLFPFRLSHRSILKIYPLRGWERDLGVPLPFLLMLAERRDMKTHKELLTYAYVLFLTQVVDPRKRSWAKILKEDLLRGDKALCQMKRR